MATSVNISILVFCIVYSVLCINADLVFKELMEIFTLNPKSYTGKNYLLCGMLLIVTCRQIPFKFFLEKEFLFILYDELRNASVSTKITDMKRQNLAA